MSNLQKILKGLEKDISISDKKLLEKAYKFAEKAYSGIKRLSGEPYVSHTTETAIIAAHLGGDVKTVIAGLLHDATEDGNSNLEEIEKEFGKEIRNIVEGVAELGKIKYRGTKKHVESLRKVISFMATDIRVLLVKFADRIHNMSTIKFLKHEKQKRVALETLEIYAPIANRLGMGRIKAELEDLAFENLYNKEYLKTKGLVGHRVKEAERNLKKFEKDLVQKIKEGGIENVSVSKRVKHLYSTYFKLKKHDMDIEEVNDILALRVITKNIEDCYKILGLIHGNWKPLMQHVRDYIASPKPNGYQSIHTTIFDGSNRMIEIQIRTEKMHEEAEFGVAAHAVYVESGKLSNSDEFTKKNRWVSEMIKRQGEALGEEVLEDFFSTHMFVFTPQGEVIELPEKSTPIDFAFAIHTDIGKQATGARINGKYSALSTKLKNGDVVEIETKKNSKPSKKWLDFAKTGEARRKIRSSLKN